MALILHQQFVLHMWRPEKKTKNVNKSKLQNTRENYKEIVISINKMWIWAAGVT